MAMKIRLARAGTKKRPYYHIVVADHASPRDGKFLETLGWYDDRMTLVGRAMSIRRPLMVRSSGRSRSGSGVQWMNCVAVGFIRSRRAGV